MQAGSDRFRRERIEVATGPLRRFPKQPFDAGAQTDKNSKEQQGLDPPVFTEVCGNTGAASPELVRQIGNRAGEINNVLADCRDTGIEGPRDGLLGDILPRRGSGLCLTLLLQPFLDLRIGEQRF
jgi:hypothetical protein